MVCTNLFPRVSLLLTLSPGDGKKREAGYEHGRRFADEY